MLIIKKRKLTWYSRSSILPLNRPKHIAHCSWVLLNDSTIFMFQIHITSTISHISQNRHAYKYYCTLNSLLCTCMLEITDLHKSDSVCFGVTPMLSTIDSNCINWRLIDIGYIVKMRINHFIILLFKQNLELDCQLNLHWMSQTPLLFELILHCQSRNNSILKETIWVFCHWVKLVNYFLCNLYTSLSSCSPVAKSCIKSKSLS